MDGKELTYRLRQLLNTQEDSGFIDAKTTYDYLNKSILDIVQKTGCLRGSTLVTTVANQNAYTLPWDFLKMYLRDGDGNLVLKFYDGTRNSFILWEDYDEILVADRTVSQLIPESFTVVQSPDIPDVVTGSATSAGGLGGGQCVLTDSGGSFTATVFPGDIARNTTDGSAGIVLAVTATTATTALFGGTNNYWESGDVYEFQSYPISQLYLSPAPETAGLAITVNYVRKPWPVYSDKGMCGLPAQYLDSVPMGAFTWYKYRDREPGFGDAMRKYHELDVAHMSQNERGKYNKGSMRVSLKARGKR